jgi:hypothetical protein
VIGTAASNGFRVQLTAIRVVRAGSAPDTATVRIAGFWRSGGSWDRLGRVCGRPERPRRYGRNPAKPRFRPTAAQPPRHFRQWTSSTGLPSISLVTQSTSFSPFTVSV